MRKPTRLGLSEPKQAENEIECAADEAHNGEEQHRVENDSLALLVTVKVTVTHEIGIK